MQDTAVPTPLRTWFVFHFLVDMLFAIPLFIAPVFILKLFGWQTVDPFMTRLAAAALFGIGIESYLGRNAGLESFRGMLNLKIIWSFVAVGGLLVGMLQGAQGRPLVLWAIIAIFTAFNLLWVYWRFQLEG